MRFCTCPCAPMDVCQGVKEVNSVLLCLVPTFMQIQPFYITSGYNVWRFGTAPLESTLKAQLPKAGRISSCVNVCLFRLACVCLCVCVCPVFVAC